MNSSCLCFPFYEQTGHDVPNICETLMENIRKFFVILKKNNVYRVARRICYKLIKLVV